MTTKEDADYQRKILILGAAHERALVRLFVKKLKAIQAKLNEKAAA